MTDICNRIKVIIVGKQGPAGAGGSLPPGGAAGYVLTKNSNATGDYSWLSPSGVITAPGALQLATGNYLLLSDGVSRLLLSNRS